MIRNILLAPDSFKGSLKSNKVADNIEIGIKRVIPDANIIKFPMADGGEGTVEALITATDGEIIFKEVKGPLGNETLAFYGILGDGETAVIEMAAASGLVLIPEGQRNPLVTTTFGTGELIKTAIDNGCRKIIIGIGGSGTNDGGIGMAQALGVKFFAEWDEEVGFGGRELGRIERIDISGLDERVKDCEIQVACDVKNPMCGSDGASAVYGPQKGATPGMIKLLDKGLNHLANIIEKDLGKSVKNTPGSGAAGGLGGGLMAFLDAKLTPGIDLIIKASNLESALEEVDIVITGEGKLDLQTLNGKVPIGIAKIAKGKGVKAVAICGSIDSDGKEALKNGIDAYTSIINRPMSIEYAMKNAETLLQDSAEQLIRLITLK